MTKGEARNWTPHDLKELARFVRVYGLAAVMAQAKAVPEPKRRGRPRVDPADTREHDEDIAEFVWMYGRAAGKPVKEALLELYELLDSEQRHDVQRWISTTKRKRSRVRAEVEARLKHAAATGPLVSGRKRGAKKARD